jgi:FkbM family methyltransferase
MNQTIPPRDLNKAFWDDLSKMLPPSPVILDLGAHGMEEAQALIPLLTGQIVWHSFEANSECCANIRQCVLPALSAKANVVLNEVAVSDTNGSADLFRSAKTNGGSWTPSSSIRKPKRATEYYPWMTFDKGITVPTVSLDNYCQEHRIEHVDLLKMDIQGAEIDAIRGGLTTFSKTAYVLTEVCEGEEYEGQLGLDGLLAEMPGTWIIVERLLNDVLLKNTDFKF